MRAAPGKIRYPLRRKSFTKNIAASSNYRASIELRSDSALRVIAHEEPNEERATIEFLAFNRYSNRGVVVLEIACICAGTKITPLANKAMSQIPIVLLVGISLHDRILYLTTNF